MYWKKLSQRTINERLFGALANNLNYKSHNILGVPGTYLDAEEFYDDAPFLKDAPFLSTLIANPNHIGCHTMGGESESIFGGTQAIERKLIALIGEEMFRADKDSIDGYVAPGGTEANIQAMWIYRNFYRKEFNATKDEILMVYSEDSHYSMPKGANLLDLHQTIVPVDHKTRAWNLEVLDQRLEEAKAAGKKYFILICNCATTMYGSVDDIDGITAVFEAKNLMYKLHVDGAFGGYIYPFTNKDSKYQFQNEKVSSITIDGHKMLQSPYGTGIFLIRKGMMHYAKTEEANYVQGKDFTICGSRSGANAISVWMIMMIHGSEGWHYKMNSLIHLTDDICEKLDSMNIPHFRNPHINIVTIDANYISAELAAKHMLVADKYEGERSWYKIVVMPHVKRGLIDRFFQDLELELEQSGHKY